jgi:serine protease
MEERTPRTNRKRGGGLLWILVILAVALLWWYLRPAGTGGADEAAMAADRVAAVDVDPDTILVDLVDDASDAQVAAIERDFGIDLELVSDQSLDERFYRAHVDPARQAELIAALQARPEVEVAEPDAYVYLHPTEGFRVEFDSTHEGYPNDPLYKHQWHLDQIRMPAAWKLADGDGVIVAVIDTGVAYENYGNGGFHLVEDLDGVEFVAPYDFVNNNTHANDDHGHGTHVAGTIAQVTNNGKGVAGVARKVRIMPLKVLSARGSGSVAAIADAIRYAADNGAKVINMSLGGRFPSKVLKNAVKYAHDKGVVVVAAAGNDGRGKIGYPAANPGAIAVAATQYDEKTTFYSNWGKHLDIAAPGGNTRVDQNGDGMPDGVLQNTIAIGDPTTSDYFGYMGTSMAAPHVAGVAALLVGEGITDPKAVEKILKKTSRQPDGYSEERYGAGLVDAEAAVLAARAGNGGWQLLLGMLMAGAVASSLRRKSLLDVKLGPSYLAGVMFGASGLFFLPYLLGGASSWPVVEALTRGVPSWDLGLLGPGGHGNALFFSALIPLAFISVGYGVRWLRAPLAGLAVGVGAHLLFHAAARVTDIQWVPNSLMLDEMWLAVNAAICVGIARLALRR